MLATTASANRPRKIQVTSHAEDTNSGTAGNEARVETSYLQYVRKPPRRQNQDRKKNCLQYRSGVHTVSKSIEQATGLKKDTYLWHSSEQDWAPEPVGKQCGWDVTGETGQSKGLLVHSGP